MRGVRVCALTSVSDVSTAEYRGLVVPDPFFVSPVFLLLFLYHLRSDPFFFLLIFYINHAIVTLLYPFATSIQKTYIYHIIDSQTILTSSLIPLFSFFSFAPALLFTCITVFLNLLSYLHCLPFHLPYFSTLLFYLTFLLLVSSPFPFLLLSSVTQIFCEYCLLCSQCPRLTPF